MYKDLWSLSTTDTEWIHRNGIAQKPTLNITFDGHSSECQKYIRETCLTEPWPSPVELTFRLHTRYDDIDADGILGIADRQTGGYFLECEASAEPVFDFVTAVHRYAQHINDVVQFHLWIMAEDGLVMDWGPNLLMVSTSDGELLRSRSIIPPGVDL